MQTQTTLARTSTRQIAYTLLLSALGLALAPLSLPLGIAKVFPGQHFVNVLAAVLIGPWWGMAAAFVTSLARNLLGIGTPLAFPGSMIGVVIAGLVFRYARRPWLAALGEVVGSGVLGATVAALLIAPLMLHKTASVLVMIGLFLPSVLIGASLGLVVVQAVLQAGWGGDELD